ncbi:MAG: hypothetical protein IPK04_01930 [Bdellovibrionales bacterium]|nr:hypothetical protein [Bdellovibrionales bacterium]
MGIFRFILGLIIMIFGINSFAAYGQGRVLAKVKTVKFYSVKEAVYAKWVD